MTTELTPSTTAAIRQGQVAVHRIAAELLLRGLDPYIPVVDVGADLLLHDGRRLQIKSTMRPGQQRGRPLWLFTLSKAQRIVQQAYVPCSPRMFSACVDFVILHAIEANRTWILPAAILDGRWTVNFTDRKQWKDIDVGDVRGRMAAGDT